MVLQSIELFSHIFQGRFTDSGLLHVYSKHQGCEETDASIYFIVKMIDRISIMTLFYASISSAFINKTPVPPFTNMV